MAIQMRQGNEVDFDAEKMIPGEWAVSKDARIVRMCFSPGVVIRMATYEAFEADMGEIRDILSEAKTVQEAVQIIQSEINNSEIVVEQYSTMSKSYAVGGTGSREEEDTDNAKYYYDQAKRIAQGVNGIVPMGTITFEELPTEGIVNNAMYNISNSFTSDDRFIDGGGVFYGAGNNVLWTANGKWDVTAASGVTGIKGENETVYRQGNVSITRDNIGLGNVDNTSDLNKPISAAQKEKFDNIDNVMGTADISAIGDGTVKGAIKEHNNRYQLTTYIDISSLYLGVDNSKVTLPMIANAMKNCSYLDCSIWKGSFTAFDFPAEVTANFLRLTVSKTNELSIEATLRDLETNTLYVNSNANGTWSGWNSYLPLTGGTLSGDVTISDANTTAPGMYLGNSVAGEGAGMVYFKDDKSACIVAQSGSNYSALYLYPNNADKNKAQLVINNEIWANIFGEHNKPSGSYTGNGSATSRQINTGGLGKVCYVYGGGHNAIVGYNGAIWWNSSGEGGFSPRSEVTFDNGILYMSNTLTAFNTSGYSYGYQVL